MFYSKYVPLQSLDADIIVHVYIFRDMEQKNVHVYILFIRCSLWKICTCVIIFRDMEQKNCLEKDAKLNLIPIQSDGTH